MQTTTANGNKQSARNDANERKQVMQKTT